MYQNTENRDIRERISDLGIDHWELAKQVNIAPGTLSIWLRQELLPCDPRRLRLLCALDMIEREKHGTEEGKPLSGR